VFGFGFGFDFGFWPANLTP